MSERRAEVRLDGVRVGEIVEDGVRYHFRYLPEWLARADAIAISLTLPLCAEPYVTTGLSAFFENLLPEGWLLELSTTKLKIGKDDAFGLLLATCADCIGAVEIAPWPFDESLPVSTSEHEE